MYRIGILPVPQDSEVVQGPLNEPRANEVILLFVTGFVRQYK